MRPEGIRTISIESLADPRVQDYANLRDRQLRQLDRCDLEGGDGIFMAEGELVVRQLIRSGLTIRSILLTPQRLSTMGEALAAVSPFVPIYTVEQKLMNQIVGFNIHRGILAAGQRPPRPRLEEMLARVRMLVVLETLANHDNVGGIFRAAAALGGLPGGRPWHLGTPPVPGGSSSSSPGTPPVPGGSSSSSSSPSGTPPVPGGSSSSSSSPGTQPIPGGSPRPVASSSPSGAGILLSPQCCDPLYRKAIRVSVGTALLLPFARLEPWPQGLMELKRHGFTVIALTPEAGAIPLEELRPGSAERPALLLGAEGSGLTSQAFAAADMRVRIPIDPGVDSLNVVVAAGIALQALRGSTSVRRDVAGLD